MKTLRLNLRDFGKKKKVQIVTLGDIHLGDAACDKKLLGGTIKYIANTPDTYMIGMGDYLNAALKNSASDVYEDTIPPMEQYETILELFKLIKHKILGLHFGNHEYRITRETNFDITKMLCNALGVKYLGWSVFHKFKVGKYNYDFFTTHGNSAAYTPEGKMRAVRKLSESFDADVYAMGHVHEIGVATDEIRRINYKQKIVERFKRYYVLTGHFLDYEDTYAERKGYKPGKKGVAKITLFGKKHDVHVSV